MCQQLPEPGLWGGKGGDKSPPRNEVTGVKGDLFAKYHWGLHALRPKASADYGKRAASALEFFFKCVSNYGGGSREGGDGRPILGGFGAVRFMIKVCKN